MKDQTVGQEPSASAATRSSGVAMVVARWVALLAFIALALLYLNSAAYSAWAAGGPPTTIREAWMHRAFSHLSYAVGAVLGGVLFRTVRRPVRFDRVSAVLAALALLTVAAPHVRFFLLVDSCLDAGGLLDAATFRCEK